MKNLIIYITCYIFGHSPKSHLDLIYGTLLREHAVCQRCDRTTYFEQCSEKRASELDLVDCF